MDNIEKIEKEQPKPVKRQTDFKRMTAGEMLYNARTNGRRKRELPTIARQLCIREEFLEALERGDYAAIPEIIYILGFARNYALELGLDPNVVVGKIKQEIADQIKSAADEIGDTVIKRTPGNSRNILGLATGSMASFARKNWKILTAAAGALVIIIIAIALISAMSDERDQTAVLSPASEIVANTRPEPAYKLPVREQYGAENRGAATVILQANSETWLKVEDSRGETLFSRVLAAGDVYFSPVQDVTATTGNAGGLDVYVNGEKAPSLGVKGVRRGDIKLTPDALMPTSAAFAED